MSGITGSGATGNLAGTVSSTTGKLTGTTSKPTSTTSKPTSTTSKPTGTTAPATGTGTTTPGTLTGAGNGTMVPDTGAASGQGAATDFGTLNGNTVIGGEAGGIGNTYGAPFINVDLRCAVPLPEGEGIGGHALGGPKAACNIAPVDQFQGPQKLL
ncbi:hypothetical protein Sviol_60090 [Streptomyces violascens]|uniref:Uncharacterized protein n=1 Tax=Streptomyces violascens TaxID=67381 RepID=A0ABQ3QWF8_9ACTN|nr:hypothetical protein Sviol_60090 [Streptomyces violascens]